MQNILWLKKSCQCWQILERWWNCSWHRHIWSKWLVYKMKYFPTAFQWCFGQGNLPSHCQDIGPTKWHIIDNIFWVWFFSALLASENYRMHGNGPWSIWEYFLSYFDIFWALLHPKVVLLVSIISISISIDTIWWRKFRVYFNSTWHRITREGEKLLHPVSAQAFPAEIFLWRR